MQKLNWLQKFVLRVVAPPKDPKKHTPFEDDDPGRHSLFKEINALRRKDPADDEAAEKAKYTDGPMGQLATSKPFEFTTLGMICFNALAIGYDADYSSTNHKPDNLLEGPIGFIIIENMFCAYFTMEIGVRFLAAKSKCGCFCDSWFVFDCVLVSMMILETWIMPFLGTGGPLAQLSIFRLLRLLRITRISKLMRAVPQIMVIIKGMVAATRTVTCVGALLMLVLYTFCILFTDAYHEQNLPDVEEPEIEAMFGTMGKSMFSLFIMGAVLDDVTVAATAIRITENYWMLAAFIVFILISSFMMLNMLIGILVEVVGATAEGEREKAITTNVREAIGEIFTNMDKDNNHAISRSEFLEMRKDKRVMDALSDLDILSSHFKLYAELFFKKEDGNGEVPSLTFDELVNMILRLRPGSFVSALDFAAFAKTITGIHDRVKDRVLSLERLCRELARETDDDDVLQMSRQVVYTGETTGDTPRHFNHSTSSPEVGPDTSVLGPPPLPTLMDSCPKPAGPVDPISAFGFERVAPSRAGPPPLNPAVLSGTDRERLDRTASTAIVEELQRRLLMNADLDKIGAASPQMSPAAMMGESRKDLQNHLPAASEHNVEAFMTLGVPQDDADSDSGTVYV